MNLLQSYLTPQAYHELKAERIVRQARASARLPLSPLLPWQSPGMSRRGY